MKALEKPLSIRVRASHSQTDRQLDSTAGQTAGPYSRTDSQTARTHRTDSQPARTHRTDSQTARTHRTDSQKDRPALRAGQVGTSGQRH